MTVDELIHLRRVRDLIDREFARPLDVPAMARAALMSPSHVGELTITEVCVVVGFSSLGRNREARARPSRLGS